MKPSIIALLVLLQGCAAIIITGPRSIERMPDARIERVQRAPLRSVGFDALFNVTLKVPKVPTGAVYALDDGALSIVNGATRTSTVTRSFGQPNTGWSRIIEHRPDQTLRPIVAGERLILVETPTRRHTLDAARFQTVGDIKVGADRGTLKIRVHVLATGQRLGEPMLTPLAARKGPVMRALTAVSPDARHLAVMHARSTGDESFLADCWAIDLTTLAVTHHALEGETPGDSKAGWALAALPGGQIAVAHPDLKHGIRIVFAGGETRRPVRFKTNNPAELQLEAPTFHQRDDGMWLSMVQRDRTSWAKTFGAELGQSTRLTAFWAARLDAKPKLVRLPRTDAMLPDQNMFWMATQTRMLPDGKLLFLLEQKGIGRRTHQPKKYKRNRDGMGGEWVDDGPPEVVAVYRVNGPHALVAMNPDGSLAWVRRTAREPVPGGSIPRPVPGVAIATDADTVTILDVRRADLGTLALHRQVIALADGAVRGEEVLMKGPVGLPEGFRPRRVPLVGGRLMDGVIGLEAIYLSLRAFE